MNGQHPRSSNRVYIRWVTWWPVPYWTDRFNYLADRGDVDFEAVFLAGRSSILESKVDEASWRFRHTFLRHGADSTGYYGAKLRVPRPWPIARGRFDAVIMTYSEASCIAAALLCWALKKPYFLFVANTEYDERKPGEIKDRIKRELFKRATGVLATGTLQRDYASRYVDDGKVFIIGNPVGSLQSERYCSSETIIDSRKELGWDGKIILLYVGRLATEKDLTTLLDAVGRLYGRGIKPKLVLVGSGPMEGRLRARASELSLNVEFAGFLQREDLAKRYAAADVFVLSSRSEPWGLVVNEAMQFGLPLVLSNKVGSAPALLQEGQNGFVSAAGNADDFASSIEALCLDEDLRRRMGEVSRQKIKDHSIEAWADAVLAAVCRDHDKISTTGTGFSVR